MASKIVRKHMTFKHLVAPSLQPRGSGRVGELFNAIRVLWYRENDSSRIASSEMESSEEEKYNYNSSRFRQTSASLETGKLTQFPTEAYNPPIPSLTPRTWMEIGRWHVIASPLRSASYSFVNICNFEHGWRWVTRHEQWLWQWESR